MFADVQLGFKPSRRGVNLFPFHNGSILLCYTHQGFCPSFNWSRLGHRKVKRSDRHPASQGQSQDQRAQRPALPPNPTYPIEAPGNFTFWRYDWPCPALSIKERSQLRKSSKERPCKAKKAGQIIHLLRKQLYK